MWDIYCLTVPFTTRSGDQCVTCSCHGCWTCDHKLTGHSLTSWSGGSPLNVYKWKEPLTFKSERTHDNWKCHHVSLKCPSLNFLVKILKGMRQTPHFSNSPSTCHADSLVFMWNSFIPLCFSCSVFMSTVCLFLSLMQYTHTKPCLNQPAEPQPRLYIEILLILRRDGADRGEKEETLYKFISISPVNQTPSLRCLTSSTQMQKKETQTQRQVKDRKRERKCGFLVKQPEELEELHAFISRARIQILWVFFLYYIFFFNNCMHF